MYLQATTVDIEDKFRPVTLSAIYCPLKHNNTKWHYENLSQEETSTLSINVGVKADDKKR